MSAYEVSTADRDERWFGTPLRDSLTLERGTAYVVRCSLDLTPAALDLCESLLDSEDRDRIRRLRFAPLRSRATASRGQVRLVLSHWLSRDPREVGLTTGP